MANVCIRITVGKVEANEIGREYKFSIGDVNSKVSNKVILDLCSEAIEERLLSVYGKPKPIGG